MVMGHRQLPAVGARPRDMLRIEQIEAAKQDRSHPAVQVFYSMARSWKRLKDELESTRNYSEQQWKCKLAFVPFAEAMEGLTFTLKPRDLISILTPVVLTFPKSFYPSHVMATGIACVYATTPLDSVEWGHFFRRMSFHEHDDEAKFLFERARMDRKGAHVFDKRIAEIRSSLDEVRYCVSGIREHASEVMDRAYKQHDRKAKQEILLSAAWPKAYKDDVLSTISNGWANAISGLRISG